jgi:hypothetical protein
MDLVAYRKAKAVDDRLTAALAAGNNPSGWQEAANAINANLGDQNRQSQSLKHGVSVINASMDTPADIEVQGRTLVSMGSSILQNGKQFVLADKKTKIRSLGSKSTQIQGVAKFVQNIPTTDTANFVGKVSGSTAENPHIAKRNHTGVTTVFNTLVTPTDTNVLEMSTAEVGYLNTLDGVKMSIGNINNGGIAQHLFSFNIIEEIERKLGRIPKTTLADKIQWVRDNVTRVDFNWYGYGSGPNGNKATIAFWDGSSWYLNWATNSNGTVTRTSASVVLSNNRIDSNGFAHFIAYADPSDGVTSSIILTDYVELVITLNAGAQLDNRPIVTRIANFEGKVSGSNVENPHVAKATTLNSNNPTLQAPTAGTLVEVNASGLAYGLLSSLNSNNYNTSTNVSGAIQQMVMSFDIVQEIERNLGRIPKATLADKVQWVKDNVLSVSVDWYGYGSGPNGYKSYLKPWYVSDSSWHDWGIYTPLSTVTKMTAVLTNFAATLDANGFANLLAHADAAGPVANPTVAPTLSASGSGSGLAAGTYYVQYQWVISGTGATLPSPEAQITIAAGQNIVITTPTLPFGVTHADVFIGTTSGGEVWQSNTAASPGKNTVTQSAALNTSSATKLNTTNTAIVASTINTDYVELQIELKQGATLHDPVVPLYQIDDATEYGNILTTWAEAEVLTRYPKVQGVQHLQNVYAIAEGENLLPPFGDVNASISSWATVTQNGPYDVTINTNNTWSTGVTYNVNLVKGQIYNLTFNGTTRALDIFRPDGTYLITNQNADPTGKTFTPDVSGIHQIKIKNIVQAETFSITNPMLTLGSTAKPFVPRNPSYLFATAKLGQIGTVKDFLYKSDGQWYVRKAIEKDVVLDGSLPWAFSADGVGFKSLYVQRTANGLTGLPASGAFNGIITKFDSKVIPYQSPNAVDTYNYAGAQTSVQISVSDTDTGFGDAYTPLIVEIQAYFYGWQAKTVDANGKPTAWRSLGDGTDAPTQTLAYVSANKAPNFTPYKLSYVLAAPQVIQTPVEGNIALNGPTQVEVGSGIIVREKVVPTIGSGTQAEINKTGITTSWTTKVPGKIIDVFKNGIKDTSNWSVQTSSSNYWRGNLGAQMPIAKYDSTAEYTITYLVSSVDNTKASFTNNTTELTAKYDTSLKSVVDNLVEKQSDLVGITSVNVQAIAELYKRIKALGG